MAAQLADALRDALRFDGRTLAHPDAMGAQLYAYTLRMGALVLPIAGAAMLAAVAAALAAGGWNWTWKPLTPKFSRLDPIGGLGRIVSKQQLIDALKASALALVLGTIGTLYLHSHSADIGAIFGMELGAGTASAAGVVVGGMVLIAAALAVFALIDLPLQRKLHADRLKMSHQELKQEHKELEGNVEMKGRVRARMREMTRKRMMAAVPKADLVVMNPTHYAVALKYDDARMGAPRVVAKGADLLALKIRDLATESKVPVLQAPVLARALYAHTKLDHEVPAALFAAVAQVLAYVYQLRAALVGAAPMPGDLPELNVPAELDPHVKPVATDEDDDA
jgi:flagellar biosynthetic protein FlhB